MIVYAGAILVLFLFVVMLLNLTQEAEENDERPIQGSSASSRSSPSEGSSSA